jgi:hypothetical protein
VEVQEIEVKEADPVVKPKVPANLEAAALVSVVGLIIQQRPPQRQPRTKSLQPPTKLLAKR